MPTPYLVVRPFLEKLVARGHELTIISAVLFLPDIKGARHVRVNALDRLINDILKWDWDVDFDMSKWQESLWIADFHYNASLAILSDAAVQAMLKDNSQHFDMMIMEPIHSDALLGIAEHFDACLVGLSAFGSSWKLDYVAGNAAPSVYTPYSPTGYTKGQSFLEKWQNWIYISEEWLIDRLVYRPGQQKLFRHFFPYSTDILQNRRRGFSLILVNEHFSLGRAKSNVPNIIEVAGMHLELPSEPLDEQLQRFLDEAEHGVIYFSLGIEIIDKFLPAELWVMLLQAFSQLKQRVVWKIEMDIKIPAEQAQRIYLSSSLPQRQLLQHPNMKLFITHGGLLSIMEAVHAGVPMLGLPIYYDQFANMERMERLGVACSIELSLITIEKFTRTIENLLYSPQYRQRAQQLSERFLDEPMRPLDKAVWWTEYVLRHKGAPHMRMTDEDMPFISYYSVHILTVLIVPIGLAALLLLLVAYKLLRILCKLFCKPTATHQISIRRCTRDRSCVLIN
ncbi:CG16732 [Drosophila busckii]|uniref:CG16732 n=2 Tax=Drosophila busckii TaxID=30019 RepID=A0A0M4EPW2_DROBS|nr:CG16732 [Drosophila busckii]